MKFVHENGKTAGHLRRELSRVTKFFLDRGVTVYVKLSVGHYRRSFSVQGGMETPCTVNFKMPLTLKNVHQNDA